MNITIEEVEKYLNAQDFGVTQNFILPRELKDWLIQKIKELQNTITILVPSCSSLLNRAEKAEAKVKSLESDLIDYKEGCEGLKMAVADLRDERDKLEKVQLMEKESKYFNACNDLNDRITGLEDGIEHYLNDPEFNTDILSKLIEEGR